MAHERPFTGKRACVQIVIHVVVTAVVLLLIGRLLRGFEVDSFFTALVTAVILGLISTFMAPLAEQIGRLIGRLLATTGLAYPLKLAVLFMSTLAINALVLKLAAAIGPGFRISDFKTAILAALLLVVSNGLIGEAVSFANAYLSNLSHVSSN
jgi:putative membrane protein